LRIGRQGVQERYLGLALPVKVTEALLQWLFAGFGHYKPLQRMDHMEPNRQRVFLEFRKHVPHASLMV